MVRMRMGIKIIHAQSTAFGKNIKPEGMCSFSMSFKL